MSTTTPLPLPSAFLEHPGFPLLQKKNANFHPVNLQRVSDEKEDREQRVKRRWKEDEDCGDLIGRIKHW